MEKIKWRKGTTDDKSVVKAYRAVAKNASQTTEKKLYGWVNVTEAGGLMNGWVDAAMKQRRREWRNKGEGGRGGGQDKSLRLECLLHNLKPEAEQTNRMQYLSRSEGGVIVM